MTSITQQDTPVESDLDEEAEKRAAYIDGLRRIADILEADPVIPIGGGEHLVHIVPAWDTDAVAQFAAAVKALARYGKVSKSDAADGYLTCTIDVGPHTLAVFTQRELVCERVVVGTTPVEVPDPAAPKITVDREIVEWRCGSILAAAEGGRS